MLYCTDRNDAGKNPGWNIRDRRRFVVRQERFKMERQGLVEEEIRIYFQKKRDSEGYDKQSGNHISRDT